MIKRKQGTKHTAAAKKEKLTIAERLERGAHDYKQWSEKFETDPRLNQIYKEEAAKTDLWLQLAEARHTAGLTQEQLAKRLGVTQSQVAKMERRGYGSYTLQSLRRYVEALGDDFVLEVKVGRSEEKWQKQIRARLGGRNLPDSAVVLRRLRKERTRALAGLR
jgi:transcriptional regulator with XRE-family HTH domain